MKSFLEEASKLKEENQKMSQKIRELEANLMAARTIPQPQQQMTMQQVPQYQDMQQQLNQIQAMLQQIQIQPSQMMSQQQLHTSAQRYQQQMPQLQWHPNQYQRQ